MSTRLKTARNADKVQLYSSAALWTEALQLSRKALSPSDPIDADGRTLSQAPSVARNGALEYVIPRSRKAYSMAGDTRHELVTVADTRSRLLPHPTTVAANLSYTSDSRGGGEAI